MPVTPFGYHLVVDFTIQVVCICNKLSLILVGAKAATPIITCASL